MSESAHVTDRGVRHLSYCARLTSLDLSSTAVTEAGLRAMLGPMLLGGMGDGEGGRVGAGGSGEGRGGLRDCGGVGEEEAEAAAAAGGRQGQVERWRGLALRHLDINSCRGVDRGVRHAGALGVRQLCAALWPSGRVGR